MPLHHLLSLIQFGTSLNIRIGDIERLFVYNSPIDTAIEDIINHEVRCISNENGIIVIEVTEHSL